MPTLTQSILIDGPAAEVFDLAQDYGLRLRWDPFLKEMKFLDGALAAAPSVRVWVRAWTGLTMTVEYITLKRPEVVAMKMVEGPAIFRRFAGTWQFRSIGPSSTEVTFKYGFDLAWPWAACLIDPILRAVFAHDIRSRLIGLKRGVEEMGLVAELGPSCA